MICLKRSRDRQRPGIPLILLFSILFPLWMTAPVRADDIYQIVIKKQEEKSKFRWNISDILATREKIKWMDMWLALHSPSPYEFYLGGDYQAATEASNSLGGLALHLGAYASIFGLEAQYEKVTDLRLQGLFHLRIFGYHDQGTNITLETGIRQLENPSVRGALLGGKISLCFNRFFGLEALYRHYYEAASVASGSRTEAGAFIDFNFMRIYGKYFAENSPSDRTGAAIGTQLYF